MSELRLVLLVAVALVLGGAVVAAVPAAVACTGDPSVCGLKAYAACVEREGVDGVDDCPHGPL